MINTIRSKKKTLDLACFWQYSHGGSIRVRRTRDPTYSTSNIVFLCFISAINITADVLVIRRILESIRYIGRVRVEKSTSSTCANIDFHITFLTRQGRQNIFKVWP